jgi:hypothetical protein
MESLLEGEAEQLTRKAIELALDGDITALRLCLERILPPRKDRAIHLNLPPIENVQQVSLAMAGVFSAIAEGKITPLEGDVLSSILAAHKAVLVTGSLELRMDDLEKRMSQQRGGAPSSPSAVLSASSSLTSGFGMNLANRLKRLEQRLGPAPPPVSHQVSIRAWMTAFRMEELTAFEDRWAASEAAGATSLLDIFAEGTSEREEILRRLEPVLDAMSREMTGKSYVREEAAVRCDVSDRPQATKEGNRKLL